MFEPRCTLWLTALKMLPDGFVQPHSWRFTSGAGLLILNKWTDVYNVAETKQWSAGPRFIIPKTNELLWILVTFACRLRDYKKLVDFPCMSPSLTCIGRIRALWPTRWIPTILICKRAIYKSSLLFWIIKRGPGRLTLVLVDCLRRWSNVKPTLDKRLMSGGYVALWHNLQVSSPLACDDVQITSLWQWYQQHNYPVAVMIST